MRGSQEEWPRVYGPGKREAIVANVIMYEAGFGM